MINKHCSDTEIQAFALQKDECSVAIREHMQLCTDCAAKAQQYMLLVEAIEAQPQPVFDFNLAVVVMDKLPAPELKTYGDKFFLYAIIVTCMLVAGAIAWLFGNTFISIFTMANAMFYALVITTAASLVLFVGIDMYRKYKAQTRALNLS